MNSRSITPPQEARKRAAHLQHLTINIEKLVPITTQLCPVECRSQLGLLRLPMEIPEDKLDHRKFPQRRLCKKQLGGRGCTCLGCSEVTKAASNEPMEQYSALCCHSTWDL